MVACFTTLPKLSPSGEAHRRSGQSLAWAGSGNFFLLRAGARPLVALGARLSPRKQLFNMKAWARRAPVRLFTGIIPAADVYVKV
jgi:hypothetical protein